MMKSDGIYGVPRKWNDNGNYIISNPWVIVTRPGLKHLNITPSQIRWEGVTVE